MEFEPLPVGAVVTVTGTGSEMNGGAVITNEAVKIKTGRDYPKCNPKFALLDPAYTYSVPVKRMMSGSFSVLSSIMEICFSVPDYEGLYFQGVAANIASEEFGFEAKKYNDKMIIVAPQLNDWGETSANQTIALAEYFPEAYNIDEDKVYANGYSGGGETMSIVVGRRPDLFTAYLHVSSKWDSEYEPVVKNRRPVYLVIGQNLTPQRYMVHRKIRMTMRNL